jgi:hypothetical protein
MPRNAWFPLLFSYHRKKLGFPGISAGFVPFARYRGPVPGKGDKTKNLQNFKARVDHSIKGNCNAYFYFFKHFAKLKVRPEWCFAA